MGMPCRTIGKAASRPRPPSTQTNVEALAGEPVTVKIGEELLPFGGAFARRQAEVDDLLFAIRAQAQSNENRATERSGAGLAGKHHAIKHEHLVAVLQRSATEGGHCDNRASWRPGSPSRR